MKITVVSQALRNGDRMHRFEGSEAVLGRQAGEFPLEDRHCSRRHARIFEGRDGEVRIEDLGSTNGTFLNGVKIQVARLHVWDKIEIGNTQVVVVDIR